MGWSDPVVGGNALRRPAIQSPNYVPGSVGWTVNQDGSAEFNNLTIRGTFNGTNFVINTSGAFFYNGAPALGNLIGSITTSSGVDSFGNHYLGGFTAYDAAFSKFIQMQSGALLLGTIAAGIPDTADAASLINDIGGLSIFSGTTAVDTDGVTILSLSGTTGQATGSATAPSVSVTDGAGSSAADWSISGSLIKTNNGGGRYTWQTPSMSTGYTNLTLRYRLDPLDNLIIDGGLSQTTGVGAAGSAQVITALTAPYVSNRQSRIPMVWTSSGGVLKGTGLLVVQTTGEWDVQWPAATANGDRFYVTEAPAPLGHLP